MAVHVPISRKAILEARELMLANKNILGPKDGEPIINPSQDMILGLYYLTREQAGVLGEGRVFKNYEELTKAYDLGKVHLHARVAMPIKEAGKQYLLGKEGYIISTVGKFIFNRAFPINFSFVFNNGAETLKHSYNANFVPQGSNIPEIIKAMPLNDALGKKHIAAVARATFDTYVAAVAKEDVASVLKTLDSTNYQNTVVKYGALVDYKGEELAKAHSQLLEKFTIRHFEEMSKRITLANQGVERV